ncbi:MAG: hypothetical protein IJS01_05880 [Lentisphaeria bacterium]|nr:hypothetical protein [Lentisphaeria bacterium]
MKNFLRVAAMVLTITAAPAVVYAMLYAAVNGIPFAYMLFCGNHYLYAGDAVMIRGGRISRLAVYRARGKPFLPVGPVPFRDASGHAVRRDFFFVSPRKIVYGLDDKGGDAWYRLGPLLMLADDLSGKPARSGLAVVPAREMNVCTVGDGPGGFHRFHFGTGKKRDVLLLINSRHFSGSCL